MEFEDLWNACIETEQWMNEEDIPYFKKFVLYFWQAATERTATMEPSEWYKKRLAEIEDNPSYLCEKKLLKTQELVLEQAERIQELEYWIEIARSVRKERIRKFEHNRQQHTPGCLAARERRKNIKRWEPFTDCNCD